MIDSHDKERINETVGKLKEIITTKEMLKVPVLIFANK